MTFKDFLDRYGPTLAVVLALAFIISALPGNAKKTTVETGTGASASELASSDVLGGNETTNDTGVGATGLTGGAAGGAGAAAQGGTGAVASGTSSGKAVVQTGKGKCRADGRQYGISQYMPPCVAFTGDNGGATSKGVTKDEILVVRYMNQADPATQAILQSIRVADDPAVIKRAFDALFNYGNAHYMTYGRRVRYVEYPASGPDTADENMKADAKDIAERIKPFAVWTLGPKVFAQELAQRGVICTCTVSLSSQFYKENPPYLWGSLPTSTEYAQQMAEHLGKRVANRPAKWAGDPTQQMQQRNRTFGLIYLVGQKGVVDPEGARFRDVFVAELAKYGIKLSAEFQYTYDPSDAGPINAMITTMNAARVTTVIMWVDPLYPILITRQATNQQYFPEWYISGSGLSDTSAAGRQYDQQQWRHAFGISPLWVTWTEVSQSAGYREFHHGMPGMKPGDEGVLVAIYRDPVQTIFTGIQLAGPKLTPDTFAQGLLNYPKTGGNASAPLVYRTRAYPTAIKDFVEVYFDANAQGKDERGEQGSGLVMKSNAGRRYQAGQWPVGIAQVFGDAAGTNPIAISAAPPGGTKDPPHEQDGHTHQGKCMSCTS